MYVGPLHPTLLPRLSLLRSIAISQCLCKGKKVHGVLRGAVRSVSKRLAVHYIATPVLPLQRVFPQTMRPKQDRKMHSGLRQGQATRLSVRRPAQRPATNWGRHTAAPNALKIGHCKQKFTEFNVLATQYDREKENRRPKQDRKLHSGLRQGQVTRLSARRPVQRPATDWGRHTAGPDALKTGRCKQTFTDFNVLPTQYDRERRFGASAKARRCAFRRIAQPSVRRQGKTFHLSKLFVTDLSLTFHGGGAGGPSTVFSAAPPYGRAVLLLPSEGASY